MSDPGVEPEAIASPPVEWPHQSCALGEKEGVQLHTPAGQLTRNSMSRLLVEATGSFRRE